MTPGEDRREDEDTSKPVVVRLTGDPAKDATAIAEANAKRAEVEVLTGRAPGLIVFDPPRSPTRPL